MDTDSLEGNNDSDDSSERSSKSSRLPISLETAIQSHPEIAHRALAAQLGLVYDGIQEFMERAQDFSQAPVIGPNEDRANRVSRHQATGEDEVSGCHRR